VVLLNPLYSANSAILLASTVFSTTITMVTCSASPPVQSRPMLIQLLVYAALATSLVSLVLDLNKTNALSASKVTIYSRTFALT